MVDDSVVRLEHAVGQPIVTHKLADVLDRVQLGALGGQWHDGDVGWHRQALGDEPSGLVDQQCAVLARRDPGRDRREMQAHGFGVAPWQDQACRFPGLGADRAEDVGGCRALVLRSRGPRASFGPAPGDLILLADTGLVAEPDLYAAAADTLRARSRPGAGGLFLKASMAPAAWAWWRGRAVSLR